MTTGSAPDDSWTDWLSENLETRAEVGSRFGDVTVSVDPSEWVALLTELRFGDPVVGAGALRLQLRQPFGEQGIRS